MKWTRREFCQQGGLAAAGVTMGVPTVQAQASRPNILWICVEDMSAHMSCYGETTIETREIDRLASEGTRFTNAFVTCPVCSPSRTALITGMYQTTVGGHEHRSSRHETSIVLPNDMATIPEQFQAAGYFVANGQMIQDDPAKSKRGKTDYNFEYTFDDLYQAHDWRLRDEGQPFFAQVQLRGGKYRDAKVENPVDPASVTLPPYYPDNPVLREDWAKYLNSVLHVDAEVGRIMETLRAGGDLENTLVFFWTDHGISHVRDKQFLYDSGIHVPLIVRGPGVSIHETDTLVEHIDIAVTSLEAAGIPVPERLQGRSLFGAEPRQTIVSARDRCDETVERMRCVRTKDYKYIRNYFPERPHAQPNRYKDAKKIMIAMRAMHDEGALTPEQARVFDAMRSREELYDLRSDPHEMNNLAGDPALKDELNAMRSALSEWVLDSRDLGVFPETTVVEMMDAAGSSFAILDDDANHAAWKEIHAMETEAVVGFPQAHITQMLEHDHAAVRAAACYELGRSGLSDRSTKRLSSLVEDDPQETVRLAAAQSLARCRAGKTDDVRDALVLMLTESKNEIVRHYAALGLEDMGEDARPVMETIRAAIEDPYDGVHRVTMRTVELLEA